MSSCSNLGHLINYSTDAQMPILIQTRHDSRHWQVISNSIWGNREHEIHILRINISRYVSLKINHCNHVIIHLKLKSFPSLRFSYFMKTSLGHLPQKRNTLPLIVWPLINYPHLSIE